MPKWMPRMWSMFHRRGLKGALISDDLDISLSYLGAELGGAWLTPCPVLFSAAFSLCAEK